MDNVELLYKLLNDSNVEFYFRKIYLAESALVGAYNFHDYKYKFLRLDVQSTYIQYQHSSRIITNSSRAK